MPESPPRPVAIPWEVWRGILRVVQPGDGPLYRAMFPPPEILVPRALQLGEAHAARWVRLYPISYGQGVASGFLVVGTRRPFPLRSPYA